ncbi:hypothetical protein AAEX28_10640 [Lentisphaerota bacterium WC36G]|nr:hypothetical protein LJT99_13485 [Lentisphaerae bacterium WC36]
MKFSKVCLLAGIAAVTSITTGCVNYNNSDMGVVAKPTVVENYKPILDIKNQEVTSTSEINVLFGFITWGEKFGEENYADNGLLNEYSLLSPTGKLKSTAVYKACKSNNADIIMAAQYDIETKDYFVFKKSTCKLKGFPAKIKGIENKK